MSQWFRQFKDSQANVRDEDHSGRTYVMRDDLVEKVNNKIRENWQFPISELSTCFPQISHIYNSMKLYQRGCTITKSVQEGCPKC